MLDEQEQALRFIYSRGVEASIYRDADGGRAGILGALLAGHRQARGQGADARMDADELPPEHPPVRNFLGIPVASKERVYGWLYFADKRGEGGFDEEDERLAAMMAAKLAVLYENAVLYDAIQPHPPHLQGETPDPRPPPPPLPETHTQ